MTRTTDYSSQLLAAPYSYRHVGDLEDETDAAEFVTRWAEASGAAPLSACGLPELWVLKPSEANRGEGIAVLHAADIEGARRGIASHPRLSRWLLQRYVRPLLLPLGPRSSLASPPASPASLQSSLQPSPPPSSLPSSLPPSPPLPPSSGHKFHLRVHVAAVGAMSVWVHATPLLLLSAVPWREPSRRGRAPAGGEGGGEGGSEGGGGSDGGECGGGECAGGVPSSLLCHLTNHAQQVLGSSYTNPNPHHHLHPNSNPNQVLGSSYDAELHTSTLHEALGEATAAQVMREVRRVVAQVLAAFARGSA